METGADITLADWLQQQFDDNPRLNQTGLALQLGIGQSTVSHWLTGVSIPSPQNCQKLARFFNIPEDDVLIIAGHRSPTIIGDRDKHLRDRPSIYYLGPRARLHELIDGLTEDQAKMLETFLDSIK